MKLSYTICSADRIRDIDGDWDAFAARNDAAELTRDAVLGNSLWQYVAGPEMRHLLGALFRRARGGRNIAALPFRCDSDRQRRYMQFGLQVLPDGLLRVDSEILTELERPAVHLLDRGRTTAGAPLPICSWCKRVRLDDSRWAEIEDALLTLRLLEAPVLPPLTHGICTACLAALEDEEPFEPSVTPPAP